VKCSNWYYKYLIILAIIIFMIVVRLPQQLAHATQKVYNKWMILTMILDNIERNYINEIDSDLLLKNAINGMLSGLDQYSVYLTAEEYKDRETKNLGYVGLGLRFKQIKGQYVLVSISDNSPAFRAGLLVGDNIMEIDGRQISVLREEQIQSLLEGAGHGKVTILAKHSGSEPRKYILNRTFIAVKSIPGFFMLNNTTGYIKITHFMSTTPDELDIAYKYLFSRGMKQIIVDLRDNSGGSLLAGIQAADRFISKGKVIVTTRGKTPQANQKYIATALPAFADIPLIVMVNAGTASVAEIFAAAIQDWDRGLLFGEVTYGKACVQTEFPFPDGSALLLTTAYYHTPLGRMIGSEENAAYDANADESVSASSEIQRWHEIKTPKGRIIYEGNGLRPDIISTVKTESISKSVREMYARNVFLNYAEKLVQTSPNLKTDIDRFFLEFSITENILAEFYRSAKMNENMAESDPAFNQQIKQALMQETAFILWGIEGALRAAAIKDQRIQESLASFPKAALLLL